MRYCLILVYLSLNCLACAKDADKNPFDHVACENRIQAVQYDFGAPAGTQKSAVYDCQDVKGKACNYVWSLADRSVSATDCEGPIVVDNEN